MTERNVYVVRTAAEYVYRWGFEIFVSGLNEYLMSPFSTYIPKCYVVQRPFTTDYGVIRYTLCERAISWYLERSRSHYLSIRHLNAA